MIKKAISIANILVSHGFLVYIVMYANIFIAEGFKLTGNQTTVAGFATAAFCISIIASAIFRVVDLLPPPPPSIH